MKSIVGVKWPFTVAGGRTVLSTDDDHIKESIRQIIATRPLEYLNLPEFGCEIHRRVFDPINSQALLEGDIRSALTIWETRIRLIRVSADVSRASEGQLTITVDFMIRGDATSSSLSVAISSGGVQ